MNKRDAITAYIQSQIQNQVWRVGDKIPSEYELAEQFNVNKKTANIAVHALVLRGMLRRGCGKAGTMVKCDHVYPKGVIVYLGEMKSFYFSILRGAEQAARAHDYSIQYIAPPTEKLKSVLRRLEASRVCGLLACGYGILCKSDSFPIVHIDHGLLEERSSHTVNSNNVLAGEILTRHLLDLGHRYIVFVSTHGDKPHMRDRVKGYVVAMRAAGVRHPESQVVDVGDLAGALKRIQLCYRSTTAIICDTDHGGLALLEWLCQKQYRVPEQISIAGFGALTKNDAVYHLTSVEQSPQEMGAQACGRVIELIEGRFVGDVNDALPGSLYLGNTCAPPSGRAAFEET